MKNETCGTGNVNMIRAKQHSSGSDCCEWTAEKIEEKIPACLSQKKRIKIFTCAAKIGFKI